jgi:hypothetical protein
MSPKKESENSSSHPHLWGTSTRDPPQEHALSRIPAPPAPFVRCTPLLWKKLLTALYTTLHLPITDPLPPQRISLTHVTSVIRRVKAFQTQIPKHRPFSFTPIYPMVWQPGLCDLCGSPLYLSAYGWKARFRCDACIVAMHLALGFLTPDQWLAHRAEAD